jgi:hypothetical protein
MRSGPLERLHETVRSLPGEVDPVRLPSLAAAPPGNENDRADDLDRRVAKLFRALADRLEPALTGVLTRAIKAWDQADTLVVLDQPLADEIASLRGAWSRLLGDETARPRALQALLAVDAAAGIVRLLETRLATFIRLHGGELLPGGRPFIDVAAALAELARRWS